MKKIKPLPCPFCGSKRISVEWEDCLPLVAGDTNRRWFAECMNCSCEGPFAQTEPQAIPAWNKRHQPKARNLKAKMLGQLHGLKRAGKLDEFVEAFNK